MGGRGGSSHAVGSRAANGRNPDDYSNAISLAKSLNIYLDSSLHRANISSVYIEETLRAVESIYKAFPPMKGRVRYLDANANGRAYASAGGDGGLHMGLYGRLPTDKLNAYWQRDLNANFHPKGTTPASIFVHEMGHQIESYLNERDYGEPWAWGRTADTVVFEALKNLDSSVTKLHSMATYDAARSISKYAATAFDAIHLSWDTSETIAEAVADYRSNGSKANPLSIEIWKILRKKVNGK